MTRAQLLASTRLPFDIGADSLVVAYAATYELHCFAALGLPQPTHVLCTYLETCAAINGAPIAGLEGKRPTILETAELFGLPHMAPAEKERMRDLILNNTTYTPEQEREIADYNKEDVVLDTQLLPILAPTINMGAALFRGRFSKAVVGWERAGLPVDADYVGELAAQWHALRMHYIRRDDHLGLYDENGTFCEDRFAALITERRWTWPRTPTGRYELKAATIGKQARRRPELQRLQHLRDQIAELRLGAFVNTIGADGRSRIATMPCWTATGRNQPSEREKVFLLSLPAWTHGVIRPPAGWGAALLDWVGEEVGLAAGLSGDPALLADYQSGDVHMRFAVRAGLAPEGATKRTHGQIRDQVKPVSLGSMYGMTKYGAAAKTGRSVLWAADLLARHRAAYPVFTKWQGDLVAQALFDERIVSPLGWPMIVHAGTKKRTLMNYMMQAAGGDCMRLAAIAAAEAGLCVCASAHDSFWLMAPLEDLEDAIATMRAIMVRAGNVVSGGIDIPVEISAKVCAPMCLGDVRRPDTRGQAMWNEIRDLVRGGNLQRVGST
jgi:hypothetical protein